MDLSNATREELLQEIAALRRRVSALERSEVEEGLHGDDRSVLTTDAVRARDELRASEARFRKVFDASPLGIAVSRNGRQLFVNEAYAALFGYPNADAVAGIPLTDQLAPEVREEVSARNRAREAGEPAVKSYETLGLRQDGTVFPFQIDALTVQLSDGPATLVFGADLSESRRAEEQRAALEGQLRQAQKLEAIGTLAGGIAHDFNNILTPVMAHAELALMQLAEGHPVREDVVQLLKAAERARDLVRQILIMTRREADGPTVPVPLGPLVREVAKFLRASLPATIEIRAETDPSCGPVLGDFSQLHQVLMNLCTNAGYAMQESGGVLTLSLARAAGSGGSPRLRLSVTDTGPGIPPDAFARIFEPYFTTKPVGKGSGLGLAVAHGIVTKLGGEILARSVPGEGTTFEVLLPEVVKGAAPAEPPLRDAPRGMGQRILVVDDEPAVRDALAKALVALGYRAEEASGAAEALAAFRADPAGFDAVLTDYTMPGRNGLDLAKELLNLRPDLPVVLGTGFAEAVSEAVVKARGLRGLVMKPYSVRGLGEELKRVLGA